MRRIVLTALVVAAVVAPTTAWATHAFSDVGDDHPHAAGIDWLVDAGVTQGCSDGAFCPDQPVTRGQMATFLHRLAEAGVVDAATLDGLTPDELGGDSPVIPAGVQAYGQVVAGALSGDAYGIVSVTESAIGEWCVDLDEDVVVHVPMLFAQKWSATVDAVHMFYDDQCPGDLRVRAVTTPGMTATPVGSWSIVVV